MYSNLITWKNGTGKPKMTEQEINDIFEDMCGGPDRAFRMMRLYRKAEQSARPNHILGRSRQQTRVAIFNKMAQQEGFTNKQITFYLIYLT